MALEVKFCLIRQFHTEECERNLVMYFSVNSGEPSEAFGLDAMRKNETSNGRERERERESERENKIVNVRNYSDFGLCPSSSIVTN
jgi:hypothetical protein